MQINPPYSWNGIKNGIFRIAKISLDIRRSEHAHITWDIKPNLHEYAIPTVWLKAAQKGIEYGQNKVSEKYIVLIQDIIGTYVDSNTSVIAYTSLRAFWQAISFTPDAIEIERLESFVYENWHIDDPLIPDFEKLELTK